MEPEGVSAAGGASPQLPEVRVDKGFLIIGDKKFQMTIGGKVVSDAYTLEKAKKLLEKSVKDQALFEAVCPKTIEGEAADKTAQGGPSGKLKINISEDKATVERLGVSAGGTGGVEAPHELTVEPDYAERLRSIKDRHTFSESLENRLKGYPPEVRARALHAVFRSGHLGLRQLAKGEKLPEEFGDRTLNDVLQDPGNSALRAAVKSLEESNPVKGSKVKKKELRQCKKELRNFILENLVRPPMIIRVGNGTRYVQRFEKGLSPAVNQHFRLTRGRPVEIKTQDLQKGFDADRAWPSEADRDKTGDGCTFANHCTNVGAVHVQDTDGTSRCVVTRSGRADSPERLQECVLNACLQQLRTSDPQGFTQNAKGEFEFQHCITSYLDQSIAKVDEQEHYKNIVRAADAWPPEGFRVIVDGRLIILKKPIVFNQPFSAVVRGKGGHELGTERARQAAFVGSQQVLANVMQQKGVKPPKRLLDASQRLNAKLLAYSDHQPEGGTFLNQDGTINFDKVSAYRLMQPKPPIHNIFKTKEYEEYQEATSEFMASQFHNAANDNEKLLWKSLYATTFHRLPPAEGDKFSVNPKPEDELHIADVEIYRNILLQKLNLSSGKQCKSGTDRTGVGVALAVAQERFRRKFGAEFEPIQGSPSNLQHNELVAFKRFFREALQVHGKEVTIYTKGYDGLKLFGGGGNPALYKYMLSEEDVAVYNEAHLGEEPLEAEVEGLTYEDLSKRGKDQYKGTLIDREKLAIGGVARGVRAEEVAKSEKKHFKSNKLDAKVLNRVNAFLNLMLDFEGESLVNERLELNIPIKKLNPTQEKVDEWKKIVAGGEEAYALKLIIMNAERYLRIKEDKQVDTDPTTDKFKKGLDALTTREAEIKEQEPEAVGPFELEEVKPEQPQNEPARVQKGPRPEPEPEVAARKEPRTASSMLEALLKDPAYRNTMSQEEKMQVAAVLHNTREKPEEGQVHAQEVHAQKEQLLSALALDIASNAHSETHTKVVDIIGNNEDVSVIKRSLESLEPGKRIRLKQTVDASIGNLRRLLATPYFTEIEKAIIQGRIETLETVSTTLNKIAKETTQGSMENFRSMTPEERTQRFQEYEKTKRVLQDERNRTLDPIKREELQEKIASLEELVAILHAVRKEFADRHFLDVMMSKVKARADGISLQEMQEAILSSHTTFMSTANFLALVGKELTNPLASEEDKQVLLSFLSRWCERNQATLTEDNKETIRRFLTDRADNDAVRIRGILSRVVERSPGFQLKEGSSFGEMVIEPLLNNRFGSQKNYDNAVDQVAEDLRQIFLTDYLSMEANDVIAEKWPAGRSPAAQRSFSLANSVTNYIVDTILSYDSPEDRGRLIKFFINVAEKAAEHGNYPAVLAIKSALEDSSIYRQKAAWARVGADYSEKLDKISKICDTSSNYRHVGVLAAQNATSIPSFLPHAGNMEKWMKNPRVSSQHEEYNFYNNGKYREDVDKYLSHQPVLRNEATGKINSDLFTTLTRHVPLNDAARDSRLKQLRDQGHETKPQ